MSRRGDIYRPISVVDGRQHPFFIVYKDLLKTFGATIGPNGIALYSAISYYANSADNTAWPSIAGLMSLTGMARSTVRRHIENLERLELVRVYEIFDDRGQSSNSYVLLDLPARVKPNWQAGPRPARESRALGAGELRRLPEPATERNRKGGVTETPPPPPDEVIHSEGGGVRETPQGYQIGTPGASQKYAWGVTENHRTILSERDKLNEKTPIPPVDNQAGDELFALVTKLLMLNPTPETAEQLRSERTHISAEDWAAIVSAAKLRHHPRHNLAIDFVTWRSRLATIGYDVVDRAEKGVAD
jgi:hypothetical protein